MSALSFTMPANACNAHLHIIDPAFPNDGKAAAQIGTVASYRKLADEPYSCRPSPSRWIMPVW